MSILGSCVPGFPYCLAKASGVNGRNAEIQAQQLRTRFHEWPVEGYSASERAKQSWVGSNLCVSCWCREIRQQLQVPTRCYTGAELAARAVARQRTGWSFPPYLSDEALSDERMGRAPRQREALL